MLFSKRTGVGHTNREEEEEAEEEEEEAISNEF